MPYSYELFQATTGFESFICRETQRPSGLVVKPVTIATLAIRWSPNPTRTESGFIVPDAQEVAKVLGDTPGTRLDDKSFAVDQIGDLPNRVNIIAGDLFRAVTNPLIIFASTRPDLSHEESQALATIQSYLRELAPDPQVDIDSTNEPERLTGFYL